MALGMCPPPTDRYDRVTRKEQITPREQRVVPTGVRCSPAVARAPAPSVTRDTAALRPATADRRSAVPALSLPRRYALSLRFAQRCRSEDRRSQSSRHQAGLKTGDPSPVAPCQVVEAAGIEPASESLLQRRLHAYPGCGREPAPEGAFPSFGPASHQPGESRLGTYPLCSPTAQENRRQSPPRSTPFPARQAWSGRTWLLKQPVPVQCWLLFCFHRLREVDPRHAIVASYTFVEPSTPPLFARLRRPVRS